MTKASRSVPVAVFVAALGIAAVPAQAASELPVLTTPNGEFQPAAGEGVLAWEQNTKARPRHYDVFARIDGGSPTRVNPGRWNAAMGGLDGQRLVYQQYRKGRSDLLFYDLGTDAYSRPPKSVNSRQWEYWPSLSGSWLLYGRWNMARDVRVVYLQNLETGDRLRLDRTKGRNAFLGPGQVNGNYVVWSRCARVCNVFRYDIGAGTKGSIANPGFYQRAPSVTAGGTVYFSRGGRGCGQSVSLVRDPIGGPQEVLVQLQDVLDIRDTYVFTQPNGSTEIYYERNGCGKAAASDIYKVREPALATLTVTLEGSGSGTVVSSPGGINCGIDCFEDFEIGTQVTLTAAPDPGWAFGGWGGACLGSPTCQVTMDLAREVTAIFSLPESVTIIKDSVPDDPQDFQFHQNLVGGGLSFTLDDDADSTWPNVRVFSNVDPDSYEVQEVDIPSGWQLTNIICSDPDGGSGDLGTGTATIDLDAGEAIQCTFRNRKNGRISVAKQTDPAGSGASFSFAADYASNFSLTDGESRDSGFTLEPGTYSVTENVPSGWALTSATCSDGSDPSSINVAAGETVTCTFTNTKLGSITVVKDALPNDPQDFQFDPGGSPDPGPTFLLDDDPGDGTLSNQAVLQDILPGTYSVTEIVPTGWELTGLTCNDSDSTGDLSSDTATIVVSAGEAVTCTFTDAKQGTITIVKDALPDDPQAFQFDRNPGPSFSLDDDPSDGTLPNQRVFSSMEPRTYTVQELSIPPGWALTGLSCSDPDGGSSTDLPTATASIDVDPGEGVTCTFTNTKLGSITIVEDSVPDDPQDFSYITTGGLSPASFDLDDD